ncbi:MAG: hypothetical protein CL908_23245 [Deltaproteobacteria bacterium]|nr:hypothetical protein [Deltaproteobacteria bacterium]
MTTLDESSRPLAGVRVLELASGIAGSYAGKILCDAGAEVLKLEDPSGDPLRRFSATDQTLKSSEDAALFRYLNASKRGAVADFESEEGRGFARKLASTSDLVIESFGPGGLANRGLDVELLRAENPALSVISISSWGLSGPWADRPATEFTQQAICGSSLRRGLPGRNPVAEGGQLALFATGAYSAAGAFAAWLSARRTGSGQHVDVSIFETVVTVLTTFFGLRGTWMDGPMPQAAEAPSIEPARDGWVGVCTYTGQQWKDFCTLIERPDLAEDERFLHSAERFKARELLQEAIHSWSRKRTVEEIVELASLLRVPSAPVLDARGVLACDHYQERGVFVENPHGFLQPRTPYRIGNAEPHPIGRAPSLGEHTQTIRAELEGREPLRREAEGGSALPFEGLRIIDLTAFWAGPAMTGFFADLGADVIKIESIQRPDGMRFVGASGNQPLWEWSEVFHGVNSSKRSITLNLDSDAGRELLLRLLEDADILAENASARVLENFGLGFERLHAHNPRLVVLRMPAWGLDGPWRDRPGFAANIEQASGVAWVTGYEDEPMMPLASDAIGGIHAAIALMGALEVRRRTGEGQLVESSLIEPALNAAAQQLVELQAYGTLLGRDENHSPVAVPQGLYGCKPSRDPGGSEWLALSIVDDAQWQLLCRVLGEPTWAMEPALAKEAGRRAAQDRIDRELNAWCAGRTAVEAEALLLAEGLPAAAGRNAHYLLPNQQLEYRGFFQTQDHPVTGPTPYPNLPMCFSGFGAGLKSSPPPTIGQHNDEVLGGELGLTPEDLARLREKKIIGERPDF